MSTTLTNHRALLQLLLRTNDLQKKGLLSTIDDSQIKLITEVFYNLLHLELTEEEKKFLKKYKAVVSKLGNVRFSTRNKRTYIKQKRNSIIKILMHFADKLNALINN